MNSLIRGFGLLILALAVGGCAVPSACKPGPYQSARAAPPLVVPEGMDAPDRRNALRVPDSRAAPGRPVADGRCVIEPPSFFVDAGDPNPEGLPIRPSSITVAEAAPAAPATRLTQEVTRFLEEWAAAWSRREADVWLGYYGSDYAPAGFASAAEWRDDQRRRFETPATTRVDPDTVNVEPQDDGSTRVRFVQHFGELPDMRSVLKQITLAPRPRGTRWRIIDEQIIDVL